MSMVDTSAQQSYRRLFENRDFLLLWSSNLISSLGDAVTYIALPLYIYQLSGSFFSLGLGFFFEALPWVIAGPVLGTFADRNDRKHLIIFSALIQAALISLAPVANRTVELYIISIASTTVFVISAPARSAIAPDIVGKDLYPQAVALSQLTQQILQITGPLLGGVVVAWLGVRVAFFADVTSFVLAAGLIGYVSMPNATRFPASQRLHIGAQIAQAGKFIYQQEGLRSAVLVSLPGMFCFGSVLALTPGFVRAELHGGAMALGLLNGSFSAAVVTASVLSVGGEKKIGIWKLLLVAGAILGFSFLPLLMITSLAMTLVIWFLAGLGRGICSTLSQIVFALGTPTEIRGRVFSLANAFTMTGRMLGSMAAGILAQVLGVRFALAIISALAGIAIVLIVTKTSSQAFANILPTDSDART